LSPLYKVFPISRKVAAVFLSFTSVRYIFNGFVVIVAKLRRFILKKGRGTVLRRDEGRLKEGRGTEGGDEGRFKEGRGTF
jgi:hypothetical protein